MKYNTQAVLCRICNQEIPCVFDDEEEVTVPQVASFSVEKKENQKIASSNAVKAIIEAPPEKVLIYLSCANFHGPFPYSLQIDK